MDEVSLGEPQTGTKSQQRKNTFIIFFFFFSTEGDGSPSAEGGKEGDGSP